MTAHPSRYRPNQDRRILFRSVVLALLTLRCSCVVAGVAPHTNNPAVAGSAAPQLALTTGSIVLLALAMLVGAATGFLAHKKSAQGQISVFQEWLRREALLSRQYRELFENASEALLI